MKLSALLAPLLDAKADHEMIRKQILAFEAEQADALEQRRKSDAERQARKREREAVSRDVTLRHSDRSLTGGGVTRVEDKTSNLEIEPQKKEKQETRERALAEFEDWYRHYPHKVQRGAAVRAFAKARSKASQETLIAGVQRYVASKPPERAWQNPATWLNGEGWLDTPAEVSPQARGSPLQQAPSMSQLLQVIRDHPHEIEPEPPEDRSSFRQAIPHLRAAGSG